MSIKAFLKYVEIRTKLASVMPFFIAISYTYWKYSVFKLEQSIMFLISLLFADMATTALNNYMDFKKANLKDGYNYKEHNAMVAYKLNNKTALFVIILLYIVSFFAGIYLVYKTDLIVLILGIFAVFIGFIYSAGPIPISHSPYGEIFSGITMGFIIFFVGVYIQFDLSKIYDISIIKEEIIHFSIPISSIIIIIRSFLASLPIILTISNIMLANNMCTIPDDVENNRFTLPYYIGIKKSYILFEILYIISIALMVIFSLFRILPILSGIASIIFFIIPDNRKKIFSFRKEQDKKYTFPNSIILFLRFCIFYLISLIVHIFI